MLTTEDSQRRALLTQLVRFDVERNVDERWYPIASGVEAKSAEQAIAGAARYAGTYRARLADAPEGSVELFRVPAWGQPEFLRRVN